MSSFLKNPEVKRIILRLLLLQILFGAIIFFFVQNQMYSLHKNILNNNQALVGHILLKHPELENEVINFTTKSASEQEISKGRNVLFQYGYDENTELPSVPIIKDFYRSFELKLQTIVLLFFIPLLLIIMFEYKGIFNKIRKLAAAAENVVNGDFSILPDDREGDFGILGHNFNIMANRLKLSIESLREDKIFLKNIISDISHQLKTPLSSLVMFNELMLQDTSMKEELKEDFLERSKSQLNRMEWLILNLLKMARLEAGAIDFRKDHIPLINPINKAINALKDKLDSKEQKVTFKGDLDEVYFTGDEEWTAEALINIVKNCIEHTPENGELSIELSETPLFSNIIIKDNGEGIDKNDLPHIFERFYKGQSTVKTERVGIGLALSKLIIEAQDGTISVWSEKGKGTKFEITFLKGII